MNKNLIIGLAVLIILMGGVYYFSRANDSANNTSGGATAGLSGATDQTNFNIQNMNIEILQQGTGNPVKNGDRVTVNYVGILEDGTKFDSSIDRGQPFVFTLGENGVIQGWELGVVGMKVGEKRKLIIPPELAYGEQGAGEIIPPNTTLIFEIELLSIK